MYISFLKAPDIVEWTSPGKLQIYMNLLSHLQFTFQFFTFEFLNFEHSIYKLCVFTKCVYVIWIILLYKLYSVFNFLLLVYVQILICISFHICEYFFNKQWRAHAVLRITLIFWSKIFLNWIMYCILWLECYFLKIITF